MVAYKVIHFLLEQIAMFRYRFCRAKVVRLHINWLEPEPSKVNQDLPSCVWQFINFDRISLTIDKMAKLEWPSDCAVNSIADCRGVKGKTNMVSQGLFFCWGWRWWGSDHCLPTLSQFALSLADLSNSQWQIMNALEVCRMQLHKTRSVNPVVTPFHKGYRRGVRLFMNLSKDPYPQMESLLTDLTFWDSAHLSSESEWSPWSVDLQGLGDVEKLLLQGSERGTVVRVRCPADPHCLKKWMDERNYLGYQIRGETK